VSEFEELGAEYVEDLVGESVPRATWPDGLRQQLEQFLAAAPELLPPTHPDGPRGLKARGYRPVGEVVDDVEPEGVCVLRRSCGSTCYCARAGAVVARQGEDPRPVAIRYAPELVAELRRRFGRHWPAEPPMSALSAGARHELSARKGGIDGEIRRRDQAERRTVDWIDPYEGLPAVVDRVVFGPSWDRPDADPLQDMAVVVEWGRRQR
jgi:hypothetical protein